MKRRTVQREAIAGVFARHDRPLAVEEVLRLGRAVVPSLNRATVYRNLKRLVEHELLEAVSLPSGGVVYERAGKAHHHHFQCTACKRVYDVPGCCLERNTDLVPDGCVLEGHRIFLFGTCGQCAG